MRFAFIMVAAAAAVIATGGCDAEKETSESSPEAGRLSRPDSLLPSPPEVQAEFFALLESADPEYPGANAEKLRAFLREYLAYDIADTVLIELERQRAAASGRYHAARELARQGQFTRAQKILEDLAYHLPETPDGVSAREHLQFDFDMAKAKWLMVRQRFAECEAVARSLLQRDLTPNQLAQVEEILDSVSFVAAAQKQAERSSAENACRQLRVVLANQFVEMGGYPSRLTLDDLEKLDPYTSRDIRRALSAIEDYRANRDGYSFVAVSALGNHRIRVVDGEIQ